LVEKWSGFATLLQLGIFRPFFHAKTGYNGRDLPVCDRLANHDHKGDYSGKARRHACRCSNKLTVYQLLLEK
jgi:hypothetical protein